MKTNSQWDEQRFVAKVQKVMEQRGRYAGCWEGGDKPNKERAIVCSFLRSQKDEEGSCWIVKVTANHTKNVAPDCIGTNIQGGRVAYEVTELVDESTIRANMGGFAQDKQWFPNEFIERVQSIVTKKDGCKFVSGPFQKIILVVHTGEPGLCHGAFKNLLAEHAFDACQKIDEAYILFPHLPRQKNYPYLRLRLAEVEPGKARAKGAPP